MHPAAEREHDTDQHERTPRCVCIDERLDVLRVHVAIVLEEMAAATRHTPKTAAALRPKCRSGSGRLSMLEPYSGIARPRRARAELVGFHQGAELQELLGAQLVALAAIETVQEALHERRQLERVERLRHVVDAADVEPAGPVAKFGARGQKDDRDLDRPVVFEKLFRDPPPVEPGHHHVEEDHVRPLVPRLVHAGRAVWGLDHVHAFRLEIHSAEQTNRSFVVDYENFGHKGTHRRSVAAAIPKPAGIYSRAAGSSNEKLEPSPSVESTQIRPPIAVTSSLAMKRPRPVPAAPSRAADSAR